MTASPTPTPAPVSWKRRLWRGVRRWALFLFLLWAGIVVVFWFFERRLVFVPTSAADEWRPPVDARSQDVTFTSSDGNTLHGRWIPPEAPQHGAVLVAGGNGGNLTHRGKLAADLRQALGTGVLTFDYPGYGKNDGKPSEEACYAAGEAAYNWITQEQKIAPSRVILCGESLGGGTAVELATKREHRALVLVYTFTSLPAAAKSHFPFLPTHTLMRTRFDNLSKIDRCNRPVFVVHGTSDRTVPFAHSEQLFAAANEPKQFLRLDGSGHGSISELFVPELAKFLNQHAP